MPEQDKKNQYKRFSKGIIQLQSKEDIQVLHTTSNLINPSKSILKVKLDRQLTMDNEDITQEIIRLPYDAYKAAKDALIITNDLKNFKSKFQLLLEPTSFEEENLKRYSLTPITDSVADNKKHTTRSISFQNNHQTPNNNNLQFSVNFLSPAARSLAWEFNTSLSELKFLSQ